MNRILFNQSRIARGLSFLPVFRSSSTAISSTIPSKAANLPPYTQIIQPYQFGHDHSKKTCLWLKNLPKLQPTKVIQYTHIVTKNGFRYTKGWYETPRNSIARSRTFEGIAKAFAEQWGKLELICN